MPEDMASLPTDEHTKWLCGCGPRFDLQAWDRYSPEIGFGRVVPLAALPRDEGASTRPFDCKGKARERVGRDRSPGNRRSCFESRRCGCSCHPVARVSFADA